MRKIDSIAELSNENLSIHEKFVANEVAHSPDILIKVQTEHSTKDAQSD